MCIILQVTQCIIFIVISAMYEVKTFWKKVFCIGNVTK